MNTPQVRTRPAVVAATRPILRAGLEPVVGGAGFKIQGTATPESLVMAVADTKPDLVVVAITDDDGDPFTEIARLKTLHRDCNVLAIMESASIIELRDALTETAEGIRVLAPEIARQLAGSWTAEPATSQAQLTPRELQVLQWLAEGLTNGSIGAELDLSHRTVKTHVKNLLVKLNTRNRTGAVAEGFRRGLIS